jgi:hypothetical protein
MFHCVVKTINKKDHRYDTTGDWWFEPDGTLIVVITESGDFYGEFLIAIHEIIEAVLCKAAKIPSELVTSFDIANQLLEEPGESPSAPYHHEHIVAIGIEDILFREIKARLKP